MWGTPRDHRRKRSINAATGDGDGDDEDGHDEELHTPGEVLYLEQDEAGEESQVEEELADADLFLEHQSQVLLLLDRHGALGIAERLRAWTTRVLRGNAHKPSDSASSEKCDRTLPKQVRLTSRSKMLVWPTRSFLMISTDTGLL
jgi:hypothetical protein